MCIALKKMRRSLIIGRLLLTRGFLFVYLVISINEGKEGLIFLFMPVSQSAVFVWHRDDVITSASSSSLLSASFHHWLINLIIGGLPYKNKIRCERCCYSDVTHWNISLSAQVIPYLLIETPNWPQHGGLRAVRQLETRQYLHLCTLQKINYRKCRKFESCCGELITALNLKLQKTLVVSDKTCG